MTPQNKELAEGAAERVEEWHFDFALSRREFLGILGAGIVVSVSPDAFGAKGPKVFGRRALGARIHLGEDGVLTVLTGKVELGQGSRTQLTQAAAEELRVAPDAIRLIMADTALVPNDGGTFGSLTTPRSVPAVRRAAAMLRQLLLESAAEQWKIDAAEIQIRDGEAVHAASNRHLSYAEFAASKSGVAGFGERVSNGVELTRVEDWQVLGTPVARPNAADIVTGRHRYPSDIQRPGMLYGKILRPPSYGAALESANTEAAEAMGGVVVVRDGGFIGCAASSSWTAQKAVEAIADTCTWKTSPHPASAELFERLKRLRDEAESSARPPRSRESGSVDTALARADEVLRGEYHVPYIQHAPMEPRAAVAEWNDGHLCVWTGTQRPNGVHAELARAFSLPQDRVRVIIPDTGGGFGGKHTGECAIEAARLSLAAERPVSLRWTREEEFTWAYFRPAGVIEIAAGLEGGSITAWDFTNINSGGSALETPYAIPNVRTKLVQCDAPLREGSYRSLAATANTFARESFMDELAAAAGADPLAFRLAHLEDERLRGVLEAAAKAFGWNERRRAAREGTGVGLACGTDKDSFVAACVEIEIGRRDQIVVRKITQAFECGAIQNPANLLSQVQGCIIMGLGGALSESIAFEHGKITNATFKKYEVPRFEDVPPMDLHLLNRRDLPPVGAGETPIIAVAPAIGNAVFQAVGQRLRALPLKLSAGFKL